MSVEMMRDMRVDKREKVLVQIEELHQHMLSIVSAVLETIRKYSASSFQLLPQPAHFTIYFYCNFIQRYVLTQHRYNLR
ncbi:hypothetical protein [Bacillus sp. FSL R12-0069]|uniref:hypothetical protein n=1 Tax=Bacillus sp. FSL R12-0069 TaxID=2975342 RepID=UPI0030F7BFDA